MCNDWIQGFHTQKILRGKKNYLWVRSLDADCSLFQFEQKENCIIATHSCCEARSVFLCVEMWLALAAALTLVDLQTCNPTLEINTEAGLHPSSPPAAFKAPLLPYGKRNISQACPAFCCSMAFILSLSKTFWPCQETKKLVLSAKLRAQQQFCLLFNNLEG